MIKTCKICGKEFIPRQANYKCCSPECSKINTKNNVKKGTINWYNRNFETIKFKRRQKAPAIKCRICGKEVPKTYTAGGRVAISRYHEECVLKAALIDLKNGECTTKSKAIKRAWNKGYSLVDIWEAEKEANCD